MLKVEQFLFCGVSNLDELRRIASEGPGGILLYPGIFQDPSVFLEAVSVLNGCKTLLSTDHEGGQLEIVPFIPPSPGNLLLGKSAPNSVERYCRVSGEIMSLLGLNMVFAPVLDLKLELTNHVIGYRSFGEDPKVVAQMGLAAIRGYRVAGISSCAKHFPGHGRTSQDSHEELAVFQGTQNEFEQDLYPFKVAIQNNVESIMIAHVVYPMIDEKPASISYKLIQEILRQELGYEGLVISDAVEMNSLAKHYSPQEIVINFFNSGGDMIILSDPTNLKVYSRILADLIQSGKISLKNLKKSRERIEELSKVVEADLNFIFHAIREAVTFKVGNLPNGRFVLLIPDSVQWSKADVSYKHMEVIKDQARKFLDAEILPFSDWKNIENGCVVVDLLLELTEREIPLHKELSTKFKTVYLITRNPFLKKFFELEDHIVAYSLSPTVMGYVFRKLAQLSKGGV